ncbi:16S rRNA (cytidine(1402)-2'-O)-methyltransferase [Streptomyces sp. SID13031]|uniref:16S rRNA (cytidine(1402)-2'-O)-methyltransferase n=1 Tax=Streptomyces sp. SID13031 TaxID=2706046 RepID=UPI00194245FD|nr:16S rRNA (cytidine(1402)-2'-O)-methyltransferase [Streptomyces sp. SID13031]
MAGVTGRLVLVGTPIGDFSDASARLRKVLAEVDVVAAEDTRRLKRLTSELAIVVSGRVVSFFEGNERQRTDELVAVLLEGQTVAVVTDAGMPSVSDPGYRLVAAAIEAGIDVTAVPGPSAVLTALALSGLPVDRFTFEGFLPRKSGERTKRFQELAREQRTMIFFEAPHRLAASLQDLADALGKDRRTAVCRELTKTYEEVKRGTAAELAEWAVDGVRGEITIVVAGADPSARELGPEELAAEVAADEEAGTPRKQAISDVAKRFGVPKRTVYDAVLAARGPGKTS